ncbi:hypothetical protein DFH06DRAFT_1309043, partial [Mycena polygramma]
MPFEGVEPSHLPRPEEATACYAIGGNRTHKVSRPKNLDKPGKTGKAIKSLDLRGHMSCSVALVIPSAGIEPRSLPPEALELVTKWGAATAVVGVADEGLSVPHRGQRRRYGRIGAISAECYAIDMVKGHCRMESNGVCAWVAARQPRFKKYPVEWHSRDADAPTKRRGETRWWWIGILTLRLSDLSSTSVPLSFRFFLLQKTWCPCGIPDIDQTLLIAGLLFCFLTSGHDLLNDLSRTAHLYRGGLGLSACAHRVTFVPRLLRSGRHLRREASTASLSATGTICIRSTSPTLTTSSHSFPSAANPTDESIDDLHSRSGALGDAKGTSCGMGGGWVAEVAERQPVVQLLYR